MAEPVYNPERWPLKLGFSSLCFAACVAWWFIIIKTFYTGIHWWPFWLSQSPCQLNIETERPGAQEAMGSPGASPTASLMQLSLAYVRLCEDYRSLFGVLHTVLYTPWCSPDDQRESWGVSLLGMPHLPAFLMAANHPVKLSFLLSQEMASECPRNPPTMRDSWHGGWNRFVMCALAHRGRDHVIFIRSAQYIVGFQWL